MTASAIIVAAGSGSRLRRTEPKAFVKLCGRTMLSYSLATMARLSSIHEVVIAVPGGMEPSARQEANVLSIPVKITIGGAQRQDSVRIALSLTSVLSELVIIQDAARPFAPAELFEACLVGAQRAGGAIAAIPVADTLKRVADDGGIVETISRAKLWQAQTPQAFRRELLVTAHDSAMRNHILATDDADLVERIGARVEVIESKTANLKITTAADLAWAEAMLRS